MIIIAYIVVIVVALLLLLAMTLEYIRACNMMRYIKKNGSEEHLKISFQLLKEQHPKLYRTWVISKYTTNFIMLTGFIAVIAFLSLYAKNHGIHLPEFVYAWTWDDNLGYLTMYIKEIGNIINTYFFA